MRAEADTVYGSKVLFLKAKSHCAVLIYPIGHSHVVKFGSTRMVNFYIRRGREERKHALVHPAGSQLNIVEPQLSRKDHRR